MNVDERREFRGNREPHHPQNIMHPGRAVTVALAVSAVLAVAVGLPLISSSLISAADTREASGETRAGSPGGGQDAPTRRMEIGADTAEMLNHGAEARTARGKPASRVDERTEGDVLATTMTRKGEMVLVGVALEDGRLCVIQQYVRHVAGGGSGARCTDDGATPFSSHRIDLSASEELLDTGGGTVSVVMGGVPEGTATVVLRGSGTDEEPVRAHAGGSKWGPHGYFIATWPIVPGAEVVALDEDGNELARGPLAF
jgi:hypothetical protein